MKKFLLKSGVLVFIILMLHFLLAQLADGSTDPYFEKLSSNRQESLILGGSRASEGLIPSVMDSVFTANGSTTKLFNFAFTNSDSPYGAVYLNAIKNKIKSRSGNGIFILSVHPWNISSLAKDSSELDSFDPNDESKFRENKLALGKMHFFNGSPNYDYLLSSYDYGWGNILLKKLENGMFEYLAKSSKLKGGAWAYVHEDGWLEVKSMLSDSTEIAESMMKKIEAYKKREINHCYKYSSLRYDYLKKTIRKLKEHGKVYLVRFPVHEEIISFEKEMMPEFDQLMEELSVEFDVDYFNFVSDSKKYNYSDGNHFIKSSAVKFSIEVANRIIDNNER
ncbi:MAG: hypothetical protein R2780_11555 [Crocinitomicaceae bacterium]|nr:hypothetical protein [Crocinitomicaceae bacterium]